jgi:hypothetical protein
LKKLHLNIAKWSMEDRTDLREALPQCKLYLQAQTEMR